MSALPERSAEPAGPLMETKPFPSRRSAAVTGFSLALNVLSCLLLVALLGWLVFIVPRFAKIFESFGAKLPTLTRWVLNVSQFVLSLWLPLLMATVGMMAGLIYMSVRSKSRGKVFVALAVLLLVLGLGGLAVMAMFLPLPGMIEAVQ